MNRFNLDLVFHLTIDKITPQTITVIDYDAIDMHLSKMVVFPEADAVIREAKK